MNYEVISAVCEEGNLTKAAKRLNYSQSAVSQVIQSYEKMLGITLFERSKTGGRPLPGVMPVIESLKVIAEEEKKIKIFAESIRNLDSGVVRIGCITPSIAMKRFPYILKEFERQFPNIRYEVISGPVCDLQRDLRHKTIDFAFVPKKAAQDFAFIPLMKDEMVVLMPKGHWLAKKETVDIQDLKDENIIMPSENRNLEASDILKVLKAKKNDTRYSFSDDIVVMKFVELGFGVCVLPRAFMDMIGAGFDIEVRLFNKNYYEIFGIAYPNNECMTPIATKFIDYMLKWFKQEADCVDSLLL